MGQQYTATDAALTTSLATIYTVPNNGNEIVAIYPDLRATNRAASGDATVDVTVRGKYIAKNVPVPDGDPVDILTHETKRLLKPGDVVQARGSETGIDIVGCVLLVTRGGV